MKDFIDIYDLPPLDLFRKAYDQLGARRGWENLETDTDGGSRLRRYPATSCDDLAFLVALWSQIVRRSPRTYERDITALHRHRWRRVAGDLGRACDDHVGAEVCPRSADFWRAMHGIALACQVERELTPRNADIDHATAWQSVRVVDDNGVLRAQADGVEAIDLHNALYNHFGKRRGWEVKTRQLKGKDGQPVTREDKIPKTTNADVTMLAAFWTLQVQQAPRNYEEMQGRRDAFSAAVATARQVVAGKQGTDPYPHNFEFWRGCNKAAIAIDVERANEPRSGWDVVVGYFGDAVSDAGAWISDRLSDAANTVGSVAGKGARGFLDGMGLNPRTILLGAGVIAGAVLLVPRLVKPDERRKSSPVGGGS